MSTQTLPTPIRTEGRTCFGLRWYATEAEAEMAAAAVRARGDTYNGGWMHGMACGRDRSFDRPGEYAVTVA